jgi:hypothetical protein
MSAAWGSEASREPLYWQKKMFRIWGYLAIAGTFLLFVYYHLHISL